MLPYVYVGRIDDDERGKNIRSQDTRSAIEALLAGREPEVKVIEDVPILVGSDGQR